FEGVATIVLKLFQLLPATDAFFGQKDYQQFRVIQSMVDDLNVPTRVVACPIVREPDGLAMSSRNRYLGDEERTRALRLAFALDEAKQQLVDGQCDAEVLRATLRDCLQPASGPRVDSIDYADVADAVTLNPLTIIDGPTVCLIACHVGSTRLIDNLVWNPPHHEVP
ncbi:MAG: pantoate--beta-alanine ligase, partial [Planctomycetota bacterium]